MSKDASSCQDQPLGSNCLVEQNPIICMAELDMVRIYKLRKNIC